MDFVAFYLLLCVGSMALMGLMMAFAFATAEPDPDDAADDNAGAQRVLEMFSQERIGK